MALTRALEVLQNESDAEDLDFVTQGHCKHFWLENTWLGQGGEIKVWTSRGKEAAFGRLASAACIGVDPPEFEELSK